MTAQPNTATAPVLRVRVVETVTYTVHVPLDAELLDQAEQAGHARDAAGVADLLSDDVDHGVIVDSIDPTAPDSVEDREVSADQDAVDQAQAALDA